MPVNKWAPLPGEELIDFPCSPDWVRHYAGLGMTRDYPAEYYQKPDTMTVERIRELEARIAELEGKVVIKYVMPVIVKPTPKQATKNTIEMGDIKL
jgi:hypothetical protein